MWGDDKRVNEGCGVKRERHCLSNEYRVDKYVNKGVFLEYKSQDKDIALHQPKSDFPFLFGRETYKLFLSNADKPKVMENYLHDMKYFMDVVGAEEAFPVQFGDANLSGELMPSGLVFKKARLIDNGKGVIVKLNKGRHWNFSRGFDTRSWIDKKSDIVWRGTFAGVRDANKNIRVDFVNRYFGKYNVGVSKVGQIGDHALEKFVSTFLSLQNQLDYKFIVSLEGNDVATNLKWILASNSVLLMTKPTKESWLLESELIPYVHYVPLSDKLDDLDEVYEWCLNNDDHCRQIAVNGKRYMEMFFDEENEKEIYHMIYKKYKDIMRST
jgi:hypothetical protein